MITTGQVYRFTKSGNLVLTIETVWYGGQWLWQVTRVNTGKEMLVPEHALEAPDAHEND